MEMPCPDYPAEVRKDIRRELLIDVQDWFATATKQADLAISGSHKLVEQGIALGSRRRNQTAGLVRYFITDEAFEQLINRHGGELVPSVKVESKSGPQDHPLYLTTARFGGTLVGFASHFNTGDLPVKNATRKALCALNQGLIPDLASDPELYVDRERFVLIMVRRDRHDIGKIASITIGMADRQITQFIMEMNINDFLASYDSKPETKSSKTFALKSGVGRLRGGDTPDISGADSK